MPTTLRGLIALATLLLTGTAAVAAEPLPMTWSELASLVGAGRKADDFFVVVRDVVDTAAALAHPVIEIREGRPVLRAMTRLAGERGTLRPYAHSSARAETDSSLFGGLAFFVEREKFTSLGGANVYGLQGGAAIRLLERLDFTARYRMLSYDGTSALSELEPEVGAPLFGFALKF